VGTLAVGIAAFCLAVDLPSLTNGHFFNDGATYYAMARSLAEDWDIRYEQKDLARVREEYPGGPEGIFLKRPGDTFLVDFSRGYPFPRRVTGGERDRPIFFGKPFLYPLVAAPFVLLLKSRGMLLLNGLCLGLTLALAYRELRRQMGPGRAFFASAVLLLGTAVPIYLFWPTPEVFYLALAMAGLSAWRSDRPLLAASLLGLATFGKPPALFLSIPLGLEPFFDSGKPVLARLLESLRRGLVLATVAFLLFGLNRLSTGEWNYQGGERKTFYGHYPLESPKVTFGNSGFWMTAQRIGPSVEGDEPTGKGEIIRTRAEVREAFWWNLGYFWVGRFAGVFPYFFPAGLACVLFVLTGPRTRAGGLALFSLVVSWLFWIWYAPDNWYGGGGTVGNRYFTGLLPLAVFLIPKGREIAFTVLGGLGGALFMGPLFLSPIDHALHPGEHATRQPFLSLPAELTMLNDLSIFTDLWRKKVTFGDTRGDPHRGWPADPKAYWLYFLDDGTYGKETAYGVEGFFLRGGNAEVVLRALEPVRTMRIRLHGGKGGDSVAVAVGGRKATLIAGEGEIFAVTLDPGRPYVFYDSFVYTLRLRADLWRVVQRERGGFIQVSLEVNKRS
jgi:hypothetical protein